MEGLASSQAEFPLIGISVSVAVETKFIANQLRLRHALLQSHHSTKTAAIPRILNHLRYSEANHKTSKTADPGV
ncbi:MAG: hypothetical protein RLZZ232_40 [Planctomycetota bacterium]|jgi:hypothetical protein